LQSRLRRFDGGKTLLAPRDLGRQILIGLVRLRRVRGSGAFQQGRDLLPQFALGLLHPPVAHRLVT
jgi:hypothetical protein